jgi:microcystin degradation protein MlrC
MFMYKKIALANINQETCSFNTIKTTLQDFKDTYFKKGMHIDGVISGFYTIMKPENCLLKGIISTKSMPGGKLSVEAFSELKKILLTGIKNTKNLDAVFLALHGAMEAENEFDTEGAIISEVRELVGKDCFIGITLDHHANVTKKMVEAADVMVGYETQPHCLPETGRKTAEVMLDIWKNKRAPNAALVKVPMLAPQDNFLTSEGPMKEWFDLARNIEKDPEVIAASTFPTQPWLDVPNNGWSCLVYADSQQKAQIYAECLAQKAWDLREQFWRSERLPIAEGIALADNEAKGVVIISDTGDAVFGGAPGDNMSIIAEMLKCNLRGAALIPVVDPEALSQALKVGLGREVTLKLGGKMSAEFSPCLKIAGVIKAMSEASTLTLEDGSCIQTGRTVLFECANLKIAVMEKRDFTINHPLLYERLGIDVSKAQIVVLKTGSNFQYFKKYQSRLIRLDSPGATQSDLTAFEWKNITHPIYPFDNIKDWRL